MVSNGMNSSIYRKNNQFHINLNANTRGGRGDYSMQVVVSNNTLLHPACNFISNVMWSDVNARDL